MFVLFIGNRDAKHTIKHAALVEKRNLLVAENRTLTFKPLNSGDLKNLGLKIANSKSCIVMRTRKIRK